MKGLLLMASMLWFLSFAGHTDLDDRDFKIITNTTVEEGSDNVDIDDLSNECKDFTRYIAIESAYRDLNDRKLNRSSLIASLLPVETNSISDLGTSEQISLHRKIHQLPRDTGSPSSPTTVKTKDAPPSDKWTPLIAAILSLLEICLRLFRTKKNFSIIDFFYRIISKIIPNRT
jgi:hypothetical protein